MDAHPRRLLLIKIRGVSLTVIAALVQHKFWGPIAGDARFFSPSILCSNKNALLLGCLGNMSLHPFCNSQLAG